MVKNRNNSTYVFCILDVDECASDNECHVNAQCTNTDGSYTCSCRDGYDGDGKNCIGERLCNAIAFFAVYHFVKSCFLWRFCFSTALKCLQLRLHLRY